MSFKLNFTIISACIQNAHHPPHPHSKKSTQNEVGVYLKHMLEILTVLFILLPFNDFLLLKHIICLNPPHVQRQKDIFHCAILELILMA